MNLAAAAIDAILHFALVAGPRSPTLHVLVSGGPLEMTFCGRFAPKSGWDLVRYKDAEDAVDVCGRCLRAIAARS